MSVSHSMNSHASFPFRKLCCLVFLSDAGPFVPQQTNVAMSGSHILIHEGVHPVAPTTTGSPHCFFLLNPCNFAVAEDEADPSAGPEAPGL